MNCLIVLLFERILFSRLKKRGVNSNRFISILLIVSISLAFGGSFLVNWRPNLGGLVFDLGVNIVYVILFEIALGSIFYKTHPEWTLFDRKG